MNRHTLSCLTIVAILAYQIERQVALACVACCNNQINNSCKCPDSGNCHPDGDSLAIITYYTHATECQVHVQASWSCAADGDNAQLRKDGTAVSICGGGTSLCSGTSWVANGIMFDAGCNDFGVHVAVTPNTCGTGQDQCLGGSDVLTNDIDCTP